MKVESKTLTTHTFTEIPDQTELVLTIEKLASGAGRATIYQNGVSNSAYWNSFGVATMEEFLAKGSSVEYLVSCFDPFGTLYRKIDGGTAVAALMSHLEAKFDMGELTNAQVSAFLPRLEKVRTVADVNGLQVLVPDVMQDIFGPSWPEYARPLLLGKHPHYLGLIARIELVREFLLSTLAQ